MHASEHGLNNNNKNIGAKFLRKMNPDLALSFTSPCRVRFDGSLVFTHKLISDWQEFPYPDVVVHDQIVVLPTLRES